MRVAESGNQTAEDACLKRFLDACSIVGDPAPAAEIDGRSAYGMPDFVLGFGGSPIGVELAEIRGAVDGKSYYRKARRIALAKHDACLERGLFQNPVILILRSGAPSLFEIRRDLIRLASNADFLGIGFEEIWAMDISDEDRATREPLQKPDMFCFKPVEMFGFHRVGWSKGRPFR